MRLCRKNDGFMPDDTERLRRWAAGAMLTQEGLFYLRQKKYPEGVAAFTQKRDPKFTGR